MRSRSAGEDRKVIPEAEGGKDVDDGVVNVRYMTKSLGYGRQD